MATKKGKWSQSSTDLNPGVDGTAECEQTGLEIQMCAHCRDKGIWKVSDAGSTIRDWETVDLSIDADGEVWVNPNEAFLRGDFGYGRHRY